MSLNGAFKANGHTVNSADGNRTELSNMVLHFQNGKLAGTGYYGSGSEYNEAKSTRWAGTFAGDQIQFTEIYGDNEEHPFLYNGFIEGLKIWGTYRWTRNHAVGSFEFTLSPAAGNNNY